MQIQVQDGKVKYGLSVFVSLFLDSLPLGVLTGLPTTGPDSERDKTILSFYVLTVVAFLAFATFKDRVQGILGVRFSKALSTACTDLIFAAQRVHSQGPSGVYRAVMSSPWLQQSGTSRR
jgi:hypothetical protein